MDPSRLKELGHHASRHRYLRELGALLTGTTYDLDRAVTGKTYHLPMGQLTSQCTRCDELTASAFAYTSKRTLSFGKAEHAKVEVYLCGCDEPGCRAYHLRFRDTPQLWRALVDEMREMCSNCKEPPAVPEAEPGTCARGYIKCVDLLPLPSTLDDIAFLVVQQLRSAEFPGSPINSSCIQFLRCYERVLESGRSHENYDVALMDLQACFASRAHELYIFEELQLCSLVASLDLWRYMKDVVCMSLRKEEMIDVKHVHSSTGRCIAGICMVQAKWMTHQNVLVETLNRMSAQNGNLVEECRPHHTRAYNLIDEFRALRAEGRGVGYNILHCLARQSLLQQLALVVGEQHALCQAVCQHRCGTLHDARTDLRLSVLLGLVMSKSNEWTLECPDEEGEELRQNSTPEPADDESENDDKSSLSLGEDGDGSLSLGEPGEDDCSICLADLGDRTLPGIVILSCGHAYHERCIGDWSVKSRECPMCREAWEA